MAVIGVFQAGMIGPMARAYLAASCCMAASTIRSVREAELLLQFFEWSRRPERRHADDPARPCRHSAAHPNVEACSTATRAVTAGGRTRSR